MKMETDTFCLVKIGSDRDFSAVREEIGQLRDAFWKKSGKAESFRRDTVKLKEEVTRLNTELEFQSNKIQELGEVNVALRTRLKKYRDIDRQAKNLCLERSDLVKEIANLRNELDLARTQAMASEATAIDKALGRNQSEAQLVSVSNQLTDTTLRLHKREKSLTQTEKRLDRTERMLEKKVHGLDAAERINRGLREQIEELQTQLRTAGQLTRKHKAMITKLQEQLTEKESASREQTALYEFIHKMTEKAVGDDPESPPPDPD
jgi:chromosome segregation ATPase